MTDRVRAGLVVVVLALSAGSCAPDPVAEAPSDEVATVGERPIGAEELLRELSWRGVSRIADDALRDRLVDDVLARRADELVLELAAQAEGLAVSEEEIDRAVWTASQGYPAGGFDRVLHAEQMSRDTYRDRVRRRLLVDAFLEVHLERPDAASLASAVEAPLTSERIRVRHLLVRTQEEAELIRADVRARKLSLADAARRYSIAPEARRGGDLGWFERGQLPQVFDECFALEEKRLSAVVASDYGYHLFEVLERQRAGEVPRDGRAGARARDTLATAEEASLRALVQNLKARFPVRIDDHGLAAVKDLVARAAEAAPPARPSEEAPR